MANLWSDYAIRTLGDSGLCPRCGTALTRIGACDACRADLESPAALELWDESQKLVHAIRRWRSDADALPTLATEAMTAPPVAVAPTPPSRPAPVAVAASPTAGSHISQQTVLAIAGAGLVAVAAIVFAFLNPDLTDSATRTWIIAAATALFVGGAWLLARQGLRVSAETIGALALVFVGLDVWAFSAVDPANTTLLAAVGLLAASTALFVLARRSGVLVWLWGSLLGLLVTPAVFGYAAHDRWASVLGHLGVAVVALAALEGLPRLGARLSAAGTALRVTATVAQVTVFVVVPAQVVSLVAPGKPATVVGGALVLLALATVAALATRHAYRGLWSFVAGAFAAASVALLTLASDPRSAVWLVALLPAAAAVASVLLAAATVRGPLGSVATVWVRAGASSVSLAAAVPAAAVLVLRLSAPSERIFVADTVLTAVLGLAAVAVGGAALAVLSPVGAQRRRATAVALWFGGGSVAGFAFWPAFVEPAQLAIALATAAATALVVARVGVVARTPMVLRAPLVTTAHALVVVGAALSWSTPLLSVVGGLAVVTVATVLAFTIPAAPRAVYAGVTFAYGLIVVAAALTLFDLPTIAVLSITSAVGSALALAATLTRRVSTAAWYAVLLVTAVPFLVGVGVVLLERSGWSALATGVTFALALTLVVSRRPGVTGLLRTAAAIVLVPSLAVVVVCLCAQFFVSSGSPIALPLIAAIVAVVLPSTVFVHRTLENRGIDSGEAVAARLAVESTALLTAAIATLLAVVRVAAGLDTTLLVLLIVGLGGATSALFVGRGYGWIIAGAAWTGALWSAYGLLGVDLLEAYLMPPAVAAAAVGAFAVARGRGGRRLFVAGLVAAVAPSSYMLAVVGGTARTVGLLAGAVVLVVLARLVARAAEGSRLRPLTALTGPALAVAVAAAASGVLQAARWGLGLDAGALVDGLAMLPILGLGLVSTAIAADAARASGWISRWRYVPAVVYFAIPPMTGVEHSWLSIGTLWAVMAVLLVTMLIAVRQARSGTVVLPPVWLLYALAWTAGVVGWSERELRVEAFSLPLGLALLAAGVIAMRGAVEGPAKLADWPAGFTGSWHLLAPGLVATLAPSVLSTATDPLTARAVMVIVLALVAILVGSKLRLAAPFVLGIVVLPIENVVVFFVQIGRSIGAAPWWITLATAGAVLLVLAVTSERRVSAEHGVAARLRDLS